MATQGWRDWTGYTGPETELAWRRDHATRVPVTPDLYEIVWRGQVVATGYARTDYARDEVRRMLPGVEFREQVYGEGVSDVFDAPSPDSSFRGQGQIRRAADEEG